MRCGPCCEPSDGRFANAATGCVDDASECRFVLWVVDQTQIGEHILDFGPIVKRESGGDLIRGAEISVPDTVVSDAQRRLIYAPIPGTGDGFDSFDFLVNDSAADSPTAAVTINVFAAISPRVVASTINEGDVLAAGPVSYQVSFSEDLATESR